MDVSSDISIHLMNHSQIQRVGEIERDKKGAKPSQSYPATFPSYSPISAQKLTWPNYVPVSTLDHFVYATSHPLTLANTGDSKLLFVVPPPSPWIFWYFMYSWRLAWETPPRRASFGSHWRWRDSHLCAWSFCGLCSTSDRKMLRNLVQPWPCHFQGNRFSPQAGNAQLTLMWRLKFVSTLLQTRFLSVSMSGFRYMGGSK